MKQLLLILVFLPPGVRTAAGQPLTVNFADYLPRDPGQYCPRVYSLSFGGEGSLVSRATGLIDVPYKSGTLQAVQIVGAPSQNGPDLGIAYAHNGKQVTYMAAAAMLGMGWFPLARDCQMSGPPAGLVFETITDGAMIEQGPMFALFPGSCQQVSAGSKNLVEIQNLTLRGTAYDTAVIVWGLDTGKPYKAPDWGGWERTLGIRFPTSSRTGGSSITEFTVFGRGIGMVAGGDVDAMSGKLNLLWELGGIDCANGSETAPRERGVWTSLGPMGEAINAIAVHPRQSNVMLAAASNGIFRSTDSGDTWRPASNGLDASWFSRVTFSENSPDVAFTCGYAASLRCYRSLDAGRSWTRMPDGPDLSVVTPDPRDVRVLYAGTSDSSRLVVSSDAGMSWKPAKGIPLAETIRSIAVAGSTPGTVYATGRGLYKSADRGGSWTRVSADGGKDCLTIDPRDPNRLYGTATDSKGVHTSGDGGVTWTPINNGLQAFGCHSFVIDPNRPQNLYMGTDYGLAMSRDGGANWEHVGRGLADNNVYSIALAGETIFAGTYVGGLGKSTDGGATWKTIMPGPGGELYTLYVHPARPGILVAGTNGVGIFRSANGGETWSQIDIPSEWGRPLLMFSEAWKLVASPDDPDLLYAATRVGILRSPDAGETWQGLDGYRGNVRDLAIDSGNRSRWFIVGGPGKVSRTEDAGQTWTAADSGLPFYPTRVTLDPSNPSRLFTSADQLFRSLDGGESWKPIDTLKDCPKPANLMMDAQRPGTVFTYCPAHLLPIPWGTVGPSTVTQNRIAVSTDGGDTWSDLGPLPKDVHELGPMALDPDDPSVLWVAAYQTDSMGFIMVARLLRTRDGGKSWESFGRGMPAIEVVEIHFDPSAKNRIYAATRGRGVQVVEFPSTQANVRGAPVE